MVDPRKKKVPRKRKPTRGNAWRIGGCVDACVGLASKSGGWVDIDTYEF